MSWNAVIAKGDIGLTSTAGETGGAGPRIGVITFPGTLDDVDAARAVLYSEAEPVALWHADTDLRGVDAVVVPGGFSYGDYLRAGAIAAQAPIMRSVIEAARAGLPVLGICNGFQVLCEAGLLPGRWCATPACGSSVATSGCGSRTPTPPGHPVSSRGRKSWSR